MVVRGFGDLMAGQDEQGRPPGSRDPWVDVALLHGPKKSPQKKQHFELGVGVEGYERGTGKEVIRDPSFKRPGEKAPKSSHPFVD